ncbi:MAG: hypothetical protein KAT62_13065 [Desulfuromonadales bacterium]|nr:hypothetical protein [Desulfuromonadales bacterium]
MVSTIKREQTLDKIFSGITFSAAFLVLAIIVSIFISLFRESLIAIDAFGFFGFISSTAWDPVREVFGAATTLYGTLVTTLLALVMAVPESAGSGLALPHATKVLYGFPNCFLVIITNR